MKTLYDHVTRDFGVLRVKVDEDTYHIRPINISKSVMKVVVTIEITSDELEEHENKFTDRIDLYCSSARKGLANEAGNHLGEDPLYLDSCLQKLIEEVEKKYESEIEKVKQIIEGKISKSITVQHFPEVSGIVRTGFFGLAINGLRIKLIRTKDFLVSQR